MRTSSLALLHLGIFAASVLAHPAALKCKNDTQTAEDAADVFRIGAQIMYMTVTSSSNSSVAFTTQKPEVQAGGGMNVEIGGLPSGAFWAIRAAGGLGTFKPQEGATALTKDCPSQIYSSQAVASADGSVLAAWTAPWDIGDQGEASFPTQARDQPPCSQPCAHPPGQIPAAVVPGSQPGRRIR